MQKIDPKNEDQKRIRQIGVYITIPFVLAIPPVLGSFIGMWLDKKLETSPFLMFFFLVLGFAAGVREVYRIIKRFGDGA